MKKPLTIGLGISFIVSVFTIVPLNGLSILSGMGLAYAIGGAIALLLGPIAIGAVPAGIHWLIWREKLTGNELSVGTIWAFACLSLVLARLSSLIA